MGPMTLSALIAGAVALSSDVCVSMGTYIFMRKTEDSVAKQPSDPLKESIKRRGAYAKLLNED